MSALARLLRLVSIVPITGCWLWMGKLQPNGYPVFNLLAPQKTTLAHRASYILHKGEIGEGLTVDHLCRHTWCVNPDHLEAVTLRENVRRGSNPSMRLHLAGVCGRGHALAGENLAPNGKGPGGRPVTRCRTCYYERVRRSRRAARLAAGGAS